MDTKVLAVGDRVIYCFPHPRGISDKALEIVKVTKVFPSGMVDVENQEGEIVRFNKDGTRRGLPRFDRWVRYLRPLKGEETWESVEEAIKVQFDPPPPPSAEELKEWREEAILKRYVPRGKRAFSRGREV